MATIVNEQTLSENVYNGVQKMNAKNHIFMTEQEIRKATNSMKPNNCDSHDQIPLRILIDGLQILIKPLKVLINIIYFQKKITEQ